MEDNNLTIQFILTENDILQAALNSIKANDVLKKYLLKSWWFWFAVYLIIAMVFLFYKNYPIGIGVVIAAIIRLSMLRMRTKGKFFQHALKETKIYAGKLGHTSTVSITDFFIEVSGAVRESKTNLSEIKDIAETGQHFFIKLLPETVIIPKVQLPQIDLVKDKLKSIAAARSIQYKEDLAWKW